MERRRWVRRVFICLSLLGFLVIGGVIYFALPGKQTLTFSPETTVITGPKLGDKKLDYAAALNAKCREGVTPENNAVVPLVEALGKQYDGFPENPDFYQELGIPTHVPKSTEYVSFTKDDTDKSRSKIWNAVTEQPWKVTEYPELLTWLDKQEESLRLVQVAANRTHWYSPIVGRKQGQKILDLVGAPMFGVQILRDISAALIIRSFVQLKKGKPEEGWNDLMIVMKLSRLLSKGPFLVGTLVSIAIETNVTRAMPIFLNRAKLTPDSLDQFSKQLKQLPARADLAFSMGTAERYMTLSVLVNGIALGNPESLNNVSGGGSISDFSCSVSDDSENRWFTRSVNWDAGLRETNLIFDDLAAAVVNTDRKERQRQLDQLSAKLKNNRLAETGRLFSNAEERGLKISRLLVDLLAPAFQRVVIANDRVEQYERMRDVAFAIAKYRAENGAYPITLSNLTPKYIAKVPGDPFNDDAPLTYQKTKSGYTLSCVGPKPDRPLVIETHPEPKEPPIITEIKVD